MPTGQTLKRLLEKGVNPFAIFNKMKRKGQVTASQKHEVTMAIARSTLKKKHK